MTDFTTDIFLDFRCKMSQCEDNCCKIGWDIEIDDKTLKFYKSLDNNTGKKILSNIYEQDGCHYMGQKNGCPFMNDKGLCSIQLEYGEDKISDICREHPRFYEWFGNYKESGVGICCEKVAQMLVEHENPIKFVSYETDEEKDLLEYDEFVFEYALKVRNHILDILQNRNFSMEQRLLFAEKCGELIQNAVDSGEEEEFEKVCNKIVNLLPDEQINTDTCLFCEEIIDELSKFDYMHNDFPELVKNAGKNISRLNQVRIENFSHIWENLSVYFIFRYFLKGVRDFEFEEKTLTAIKSVTAIYLILAEIQLEKGTLDKNDFIFAIKEFSKEVEYSDNIF